MEELGAHDLGSAVLNMVTAGHSLGLNRAISYPGFIHRAQGEKLPVNYISCSFSFPLVHFPKPLYWVHPWSLCNIWSRNKLLTTENLSCTKNPVMYQTREREFNQWSSTEKSLWKTRWNWISLVAFIAFDSRINVLSSVWHTNWNKPIFLDAENLHKMPQPGYLECSGHLFSACPISIAFLLWFRSWSL